MKSMYYVFSSAILALNQDQEQCSTLTCFIILARKVMSIVSNSPPVINCVGLLWPLCRKLSEPNITLLEVLEKTADLDTQILKVNWPNITLLELLEKNADVGPQILKVNWPINVEYSTIFLISLQKGMFFNVGTKLIQFKWDFFRDNTQMNILVQLTEIHIILFFNSFIPLNQL